MTAHNFNITHGRDRRFTVLSPSFEEVLVESARNVGQAALTLGGAARDTGEAARDMGESARVMSWAALHVGEAAQNVSNAMVTSVEKIERFAYVCTAIFVAYLIMTSMINHKNSAHYMDWQ